jgi:hypothetical protein
MIKTFCDFIFCSKIKRIEAKKHHLYIFGGAYSAEAASRISFCLLDVFLMLYLNVSEHTADSATFEGRIMLDFRKAYTQTCICIIRRGGTHARDYEQCLFAFSEQDSAFV